MNQNTINALIGRGIDTVLAQNLSANNYTLGILKQKTQQELTDLGLNEEQASLLLTEPRSPIPENIVNILLYKNKRTCCICRDPNKSVVIHHIKEWHVSHSHNESNLAVLCLEHHNEAHTAQGLSQNLSESELRLAKKNWEHDSSILDMKNIFQLKHASEYANWGWINIPRLFEFILNKKQALEVANLNVLKILEDGNVIDDRYILKPEEEWNYKSSGYYFINFGEGMYIAHYLSSVIEQVFSNIPLVDITEGIRNVSWLKSMVTPNTFITAQLPFYFTDHVQSENHKDIVRKAYYRGHGVRLEYTYQRWYSLSSSAMSSWMMGHQTQTIIGIVRSIVEENGELVINISCLAAGSYFKQHPARSQYLSSKGK